MRILVLGGTQFVGRHLVEAAVERGHNVTLFHRGKTNPGLFDGEEKVEKVLGDRFSDLERLDGEWDWVLDTSAYTPRAVKLSAEYLKGKAGRYGFISTTAVYRDFSKKGVDETDYVKTLEDPDVEEVNASTYGPLKTECEGVVKGVYGKDALIIRPGVVGGPYDPTDRFTYWVCRTATGGEVLAPGEPEADVQVIDARDLARWTIECMEKGERGTYNAAGEQVSFEAMLEACKEGTGSDARFIWVSEEFLKKVHLEGPKMPLWHPGSDKRKVGIYAVDSSLAVEKGLKRRPLAETARDTYEWAKTLPEDHEWRTGISLLEEKEYLDAWRDE